MLEAGKYLFQIFFRVFEFRVVSIGKVHEKLRRTQRKQRTTSNVSLIHFLGVWCWVFYISIVKKENCLFGTVNIKGKWKTNQKNNNDNIFFFCARAKSINLESMKIEELAKYICQKNIEDIGVRLKWKLITVQREGKTILNISNSIDHVRGSTRSSMIGFSLPVLRIILTINFRAKYISI